jgi:DNA invertase Pin-like site-specific DNA recombinase
MSRLRCAIYTRKSSEEGLEQAFNSLDAQREACQAYILSQKSEGWTPVAAHYDDGGYSGGSMDRPALKALLADIAAGRVDVVVVYKVDRLTRSLTDFARIVDVLDKAGASFVSVTQAFNTTTSMGRLTLNVLLSFAQFEREVTGERIRDKIAASKARGIWMGGNLPFGYDTRDRLLLVNETEAPVVREMFRLYVELRSVHALADELERRGVLSKRRTSAAGNVTGGIPFSRGALFHLLRNRIYLGDIVHRGKAYPGLHAAIVDGDLFEAAQVQLAANRLVRKTGVNGERSALCGLLFDHTGSPMSPTHSRGKSGGRYRYYVSTQLQRGQKPNNRTADELLRIPAEPVEQLALDRLRRLTGRPTASWSELAPILKRVEVRPQTVTLVVHPPVGIAVDDRLAPGDAARMIDDEHLQLVCPVRMKSRGGRTWLLAPAVGKAVAGAHPDRSLIQALRKAHELVASHGLLPTSRGGETLDARSLTDPYLRRVLRLAFLAPDIQQAILDGAQPSGLKLKQIILRPIPFCWEDQRRAFGFETRS